MIRWLGVGGWLTVAWIALWGEITVANFASGVVVATLLLVVYPLERDERRGAFRPVRGLHFVAFFIRQLVTANAQVAWEVVTPRNRDNEGIIALPVAASCTTTVLTLVVNSIGLTPGSMVIDLTESPRVLYVHILHLDDVDQARANLMRFQELAVKAFGSHEAIVEVTELTAALPRGAR
jgi:multicomponent Na+:H+ antiporter subunit E